MNSVLDNLDELIPPVYRFALRLTGDRHAAEDVVQETMLRAWSHRRRLRDPETVRTWLFRIAVNVHRDGVRKASVRRRDRLRIARPEHVDERATDEHETLDAALAALDRLPERQRDVLFLVACEGCTLEQVASILDISYAAAKASLSLARQRVLDDVNANART